MDALSAISIIVSLLVAALYGWLLNYLLHLKQAGCNCALGWRWYSIVAFMGLTVLNILATVVNGGKSAIGMLPKVIGTAYALFGLFNIYAMLSYVHELKKESCKCSEGTAREVLKFLAIFQLVFLAIALLTAVAVFATVGKALADAKPRASRRASAK